MASPKRPSRLWNNTKDAVDLKTTYGKINSESGDRTLPAKIPGYAGFTPGWQFTIGYSRAYGTDKVFSEVPDFQGADAPWGGTDLTEGMDMQKEMIGGFHDDAPVHVMSQRARDIHHAAQAQGGQPAMTKSMVETLRKKRLAGIGKPPPYAYSPSEGLRATCVAAEKARTTVFPADLWRMDKNEQTLQMTRKPNVSVKLPALF